MIPLWLLTSSNRWMFAVALVWVIASLAVACYLVELGRLGFDRGRVERRVAEDPLVRRWRGDR